MPIPTGSKVVGSHQKAMVMKVSTFGFLGCLALLAGISPVQAETPRLEAEWEPFVRPIASTTELELVEVRRATSTSSSATTSPWSFSLTQTSDYGTNLALPIGLTPANTLLAPVGDPALAGILTGVQANTLGILGNLGILPVPPGAPPVGIFEDDFQFQTTAATQYQRQVGEFGTFTATYTYYQSLHPDVDEVDLQSHTPTAAYALKLTDRLTTAAYYNYSYYFLSGSSFLSQNRVGLLSTFVANERWDFAAGVNYSNVNFRQQSDFLNSDNYACALEATRYFNDDRTTYLKVGYGPGYSDARLSGFAYQLNNVYATYRELFGRDNRNEVRFSGGYGLYDFIGPDPLQPGIFRADNIWTTGMFYGRKINDNMQLFAQYTYLNSNSNVARQLYNSDLISFGVTYAR